MANVKNLSLSHLKKQDTEKYKEKKQVLFHDGTKVDVNMVFRLSVQNDLNTELLHLLQTKVENRENVEGISIMAVAFSLIIKYFTSIDIKGAKTFNDYLEMYSILEDNGYLEPIVKAFDPMELQKSMDNINKVISRWTNDMGKVIDEIKRERSLKEESSDVSNEESE